MTTNEKPAKGTRCCQQVYSGRYGRGHQCANPAKVVRDGKAYCGRHDPVAVKARKDKRNAEWEERWDAEAAARAQAEAARAERDRRAACFDDLLAAVESLLPLHEACGHARTISIAHAAIAKARGRE